MFKIILASLALAACSTHVPTPPDTTHCEWPRAQWISARVIMQGGTADQATAVRDAICGVGK